MAEETDSGGVKSPRTILRVCLVSLLGTIFAGLFLILPDRGSVGGISGLLGLSVVVFVAPFAATFSSGVSRIPGHVGLLPPIILSSVFPVVMGSGGGIQEVGGMAVLSGSYALALYSLTRSFQLPGGSPLLGQALLTLLGALGLWGPYLLSDWIEAASTEGLRSGLIRLTLILSPFGPASDLLGYDWLRGNESYARSSIGSLYFFRYPDWRMASLIYTGVAVLGGLPRVIVRQWKRRALSSTSSP